MERDDLDVLKNSATQLIERGVLLPDRTSDMLPNLDFAYVRGSFPRFTVTHLPLEAEAERRSFPLHNSHMDQASRQRAGKVADACVRHLMTQPVMIPSVTLSNKIVVSTRVYDLELLDVWAPATSDNDSDIQEYAQPQQQTTWTRALYTYYSNRDYDCKLVSETGERDDFLHSAVRYMVAKSGVRSDFFSADHHLTQTSPYFLAHLLQHQLPVGCVPPPDSHLYARPVEQPITQCVMQHFRDGTPLPAAIWNVLGNETMRKSPILPSIINPDAFFNTVRQWKM